MAAVSPSAGDLPQLQRALHALQQTRARLDAVEQARTEPLAVIGMSCRFPGGASGPEAFWELLREGRDGITEVPAGRWNPEALYDPDAEAVGKLATRWGGFIDGVDQFDPSFFGISPREAAQMDPQQRLLLEVAWEALENAGQPTDRLAGSATGVFVGIHSHSNDYTWLQLRELEDIGAYTSTGTAHSIVANRLSYWLDLGGPSVAVDTACSASLVAVHLAVQSLRAGECDLALAGGVNLLLSPEVTAALSRLRMMASDGRCKTFDSRADGFVRGEGCGVVVLERLSDALAAGDPILALIAGSAVNQDGATNGLTAPSGLAQRDVVRRALADARVDPSKVGYVETHGTGTSLGDPIEVEALAEALGAAGDSPCLLGAVKSNIGHLEGAAGIAGLIKTVLALQHGTIPPNLHFRQLNPHIDLAGTRFEIPTAPRPWRPGADRVAGVSSFGFGGTNAHLILKEAPRPAAAPMPATRPERARLLPISAHSPAALRALAGSYAAWLAGSPPPLDDLVYTASVRRTRHEHRLAVVGGSVAELRDGLSMFLAGDERPEAPWGRADPEARRRLVWVFSGQGAQRPGMGQGLLGQEPVFRETLEACDRFLRPLAGWSVLDELAAPAERSRLERTDVAQPAMFALQVALAALWRSWGIVPDAVLGHSVGEVAAAHVAGALSLEDAIRVIHHRGRVMQVTTGSAKMLAVGLSRADAEAFLAGCSDGISLAAVNGPSSCVLSGDAAVVDAAAHELSERGVFVRLIPLSHAFHSPQMEPARAELVRALAGLRPQPATMPVFSSVTGRLASSNDFDGLYWGRNVREPVLFADAVAAATAAGFDAFLEIGPHPLLRTALEQCAGAGEGLILGSLDRALEDRTALLQSLAALHIRGYAVAWQALYPAGNVVPLPSYPWQRSRYWVAPARERPASRRDEARLPGRLLSSPAIAGFVFESRLDAEAVAFLGEHRIDGDAVVPAALFVAMAATAGRAALERESVEVRDLAIVHPLLLPASSARIVHSILQPPADRRSSWELHSRDADHSGGWILHATASVAVAGSGTPAAEAARDLLEDLRERCSEASREPALSADPEADHRYPLLAVDRVWRGRGEALAQLRFVAGNTADAQASRPAMLLDAGFRLAGAVGAAAGDRGHRYVVASVRHLRLAALPPDDLYCHIHLDGNQERGPGFCGDARFFDPMGACVGSAEGIRFARVARKAVAISSPTSADNWLYEVVWRPRSILSRPSPRADAFEIDAARVADSLRTAASSSTAAGADRALPVELDRASAACVVQVLRSLGLRLLPGERIILEEIGSRFALRAHHVRLLRRMLGMLEEDGLVGRRARGWTVLRAPEDTSPDAVLDRLLQRFPDHEIELAMFRRCAGGLAEVLRGRCDPLQLLFPEGSLDAAETLYRDAPLSREPNTLVRRTIERVVASLPASRVLRILEIGAGTGGTTAHLLPHLPPGRAEYVFTDVSRVFLDRARVNFGRYPSVRFELLDIEQEPETQGFAPAQFDVVLAANVLHATADLRQTVARARRLVAPGGLLVLLEGTCPTRWIDLVFGQTEGWWKFADAGLRPEHPLLTPAAWASLLESQGFGDVQVLRPQEPAGGTSFEQAVILAQATARAADEVVVAPHSMPKLASRHLIFADASGVGQQLADALGACGRDHAVVRPGEPVALAELVSTWLAAGADAPGTLVYLCSLDGGSDEPTAAEIHHRVRTDCAALIAVARALIGADRPARLWIVTRGGQPVAGAVTDPAPAALWGLGRAIALEAPTSWGGLIDLAPTGAVRSDVEDVLAQLAAGDGEDQAAFRGGQRFVPRLTLLDSPDPARPTIRGDAAYLITGGLGSLGLELARWLAERGAGHVVLIGRTALPDRAEWPALPADSAAAQRIAAIRDIEGLGATVTPVAADVGDPEAMARLLARFGGEMPPLKGVFHGAAAMEFATITRIEPHQLEATLRPKVLGAWVLHELTRNLDLDHFVLFSSVAGLWGSRGMAHYAAANQFLDALAHYRKARGLAGLAVDWGGWAGGDLTRAANRFLEQSDFRLMPADLALDALAVAMAAGVAQRAVAWVDWPSLRAGYELHSGRRFLHEIELVEETAATAIPAEAPTPASPLLQLEDVDEGEARSLLTSLVRREVAAVLDFESAQLMEPGQGFFKLGMDSLMTVELRGRLERSVGLKLPTTIAFEYPTVESLAGYLAGVVRRRPPEQAPPNRVAALPPQDGIGDAELDSLSESELATMLDVAVADLLADEAAPP